MATLTILTTRGIPSSRDGSTITVPSPSTVTKELVVRSSKLPTSTPITGSERGLIIRSTGPTVIPSIGSLRGLPDTKNTEPRTARDRIKAKGTLPKSPREPTATLGKRLSEPTSTPSSTVVQDEITSRITAIQVKSIAVRIPSRPVAEVITSLVRTSSAVGKVSTSPLRDMVLTVTAISIRSVPDAFVTFHKSRRPVQAVTCKTVTDKPGSATLTLSPCSVLPSANTDTPSVPVPVRPVIYPTASVLTI